MRVRTQLVLAFLVLAVLPLAGIVFYSYLTSQRAFRQAVEAASTVLAEEMSEQLGVVQEDIRERLEALARLPIRSLVEDPAADESIRIYVDLMARMGAVADLVDWFEFAPTLADPAAGQASEPLLIYPSLTLSKALQRLDRRSREEDDAGIPAEYLAAMVREAVQSRERLGESELAAVEARDQEMSRLLGSEFTSPVQRGEQIVGELKAMVPASQILRQVLARTPRAGDEIPFAVDVRGDLFVENPEDRRLLTDIGIPGSGPATTRGASRGWLVVELPDESTGLTFGIARPVALPLQMIGRTAVRNLAYGMLMVVLAMFGILWLSRRMTRNLDLLTTGVEQLAAGRLDARVPLRSRDEFGRLARTFNRMATELSENQRRLLDEERRCKEQEIQQRLLEAENRRTSKELEEARQFQLSLLPKSLPTISHLEIAVLMKTAAEVGGDYYDFFLGSGESLTAVIGDAAGHGLRAGTMVTVVKGLLTTEISGADLPALLGTATRAIKQMELGRMNMALTLARFEPGRVCLSAAGMPPALVHRRRSASIEEVTLVGMPLGGLADATYEQWSSDLAPGDTVLLMTDGLPELLSQGGEPLGYPRVRELFAEVAMAGPEEIISALAAAAAAWTGVAAPTDDMTFLVLRAKQSA